MYKNISLLLVRSLPAGLTVLFLQLVNHLFVQSGQPAPVQIPPIVSWVGVLIAVGGMLSIRLVVHKDESLWTTFLAFGTCFLSNLVVLSVAIKVGPATLFFCLMAGLAWIVWISHIQKHKIE